MASSAPGDLRVTVIVPEPLWSGSPVASIRPDVGSTRMPLGTLMAENRAPFAARYCRGSVLGATALAVVSPSTPVRVPGYDRGGASLLTLTGLLLPLLTVPSTA